MKGLPLKRITELTEAELLYEAQGYDDTVIRHVAATDLMSDALTVEHEDLLLVTALASPQVLRTADIIGAPAVLFTLGKTLPHKTTELARQLGVTLLRTRLPKFEACALIVEEDGRTS